ncbi:28644_t:CDS:1 [Gigaspora margarita]|uniref:28644_t:CDS:1 n=1 Tax=Gigaspora margarita TaxID=4874 RepID=A0ABN7VHZ2_GIGMA|nr:28644_t:CDS:1 [Gigaspora margarita]
MDKLQLYSTNIQNENHLNKYWNTWENSPRTTINKHIPYSYSSPQTFHSYSFKTTQLHKALTLMNKTISLITKSITPFTLDHITKMLNNNLQKIQSFKPRSTNNTTLPATLNKLQDNITNTFDNTSNPIQSKKIRT